jgi:hypothetical protein
VNSDSVIFSASEEQRGKFGMLRRARTDCTIATKCLFLAELRSSRSVAECLLCRNSPQNLANEAQLPNLAAVI